MARVMYPVLFWLFVEVVIVFWPSGQSVTLLQMSGGWVRVQAGKATGWLQRSGIKSSAPWG